MGFIIWFGLGFITFVLVAIDDYNTRIADLSPDSDQRSFDKNAEEMKNQLIPMFFVITVFGLGSFLVLIFALIISGIEKLMKKQELRFFKDLNQKISKKLKRTVLKKHRNEHPEDYL